MDEEPSKLHCVSKLSLVLEDRDSETESRKSARSKSNGVSTTTTTTTTQGKSHKMTKKRVSVSYNKPRRASVAVCTTNATKPQPATRTATRGKLTTAKKQRSQQSGNAADSFLGRFGGDVAGLNISSSSIQSRPSTAAGDQQSAAKFEANSPPPSSFARRRTSKSADAKLCLAAIAAAQAAAAATDDEEEEVPMQVKSSNMMSMVQAKVVASKWRRFGGLARMSEQYLISVDTSNAIRDVTESKWRRFFKTSKKEDDEPTTAGERIVLRSAPAVRPRCSDVIKPTVNGMRVFGISKGGISRAIVKFSAPPPPHPFTICFHFPSTFLTHRYVLDMVRAKIDAVEGSKVKTIQFIDRNTIHGTQGLDNRWLVTVNIPEARDYQINDVTKYTLWVIT